MGESDDPVEFLVPTVTNGTPHGLQTGGGPRPGQPDQVAADSVDADSTDAHSTDAHPADAHSGRADSRRVEAVSKSWSSRWPKLALLGIAGSALAYGLVSGGNTQSPIPPPEEVTATTTLGGEQPSVSIVGTVFSYGPASELIQDVGGWLPVSGVGAIISSPTGTGLVDLGMLEHQVSSAGAFETRLSTPTALLGWGAEGIVTLYPNQNEHVGLEVPQVAGDPDPVTKIFGEPLTDLLRSDLNGLQLFAHDDPDLVWQIFTYSDHSILFEQRISDGGIVEEHSAPELSWNFSGGAPIGIDEDGDIYELTPEGPEQVRKVGEVAGVTVGGGTIVATDARRALVRDCPAAGECVFRWFSRRDWSELDLQVPDLHQDWEQEWEIVGGGRWLMSLTGPIVTLVEIAGDTTTTVPYNSGHGAFVSPDGQWLVWNDDHWLVALNLETGSSSRLQLIEGGQILGLVDLSPQDDEIEETGEVDPESWSLTTAERAAHERAVARAATFAQLEGLLESISSQILVDVEGSQVDDSSPGDAGFLVVAMTFTASPSRGLLDLDSGEIVALPGMAEVQYVDDEVVVGASAEDGELAGGGLILIDRATGNRTLRPAPVSGSEALFAGPEAGQYWIEERDLPWAGTARLVLVESNSLVPIATIEELGDFYMKRGGRYPLGSQTVHTVNGGPVAQSGAHVAELRGTEIVSVRSGDLLGLGLNWALLLECPADRESNGETVHDECEFVQRNPADWSLLDRHSRPANQGFNGIYGQGRWLGALDVVGTQYLFDTSTGNRIYSYDLFNAYDVSPDGRWLLLHDPSVGLSLYDLDSVRWDSNGEAKLEDLDSTEFPFAAEELGVPSFWLTFGFFESGHQPH